MLPLHDDDAAEREEHGAPRRVVVVEEGVAFVDVHEPRDQVQVVDDVEAEHGAAG